MADIMTDGDGAGVMPDRYDFHASEARWQQAWAERGTFTATDDGPREKLYVLQMFPYPSGHLHAGHIRNYVLGDAQARFWRMKGYNVMHPMGFDSFGLPAEQAAIDRGIQPRDWIATCVNSARRQFQRYGFSFDWSREVVTSEPEYYRWTQWLFLKFHEAGLVYRKDIEVNWCDMHGVLANDEVKEGGCWRCGAPVVKQKMAQWCMHTTKYAQRLLDGLDKLPGWSSAVSTMQRNWLGRSEGTNIVFQVPAINDTLTVFTTRVDTIFGCTFMAIAPDHPLAAACAAAGGTSEMLSQFATECARENVKFTVAEEKPKRGIYLGVDCLNPFNGETVQVWATNYVVSDFGTGAVMAVPAHDTRDHAFALEYGLPIKQVIVEQEEVLMSPGAPASLQADNGGQGRPPSGNEDVPPCYPEKGVCLNSGGFDGLDFKAAKAAMDTWLERHHCGGPAVEWRLRDWNMSRQRFWGAPLPMVHCEKCGWQRVPYAELPVELPAHADYSDIRVSPLANDAHWQRTTCPACGGEARRETDTMTTFMCSAWYYLRFCDPGNQHALFDRAKVEAWLPVDYYVGGKEHAVGHLLYSRFITEVLHDLGLLDLTKRDHTDAAGAVLHDEPFRRLFNQGIVYKDGAKMSKSKGNVVSADELADSYGADTARLFAFFGGPADQDLEWSTSGVEGCYRFLKRVWRLARDISAVPALVDEPCTTLCDQVMRATHIAIAGVTADVEHWRFNTAIAKLMEFLNTLERAWGQAGGQDAAGVFHYAVLTIAQLLSPFAPHIAEELWAAYGQPGLCTESDWPLYDESMLVEASIEIPVQVNGKLRGRVTIDKDAPAEQVLALAKAEAQVATWLDGKQLVKEIYVPGKLVTLVVK
jgi:leucyl-tRNA synthetase